MSDASPALLPNNAPPPKNDSPTRTSAKVVLDFFKHPIVALVSGVFLALFPVWLTQKEKDPVYLLSGAEMIGRPPSLAPRLSIRWDGQEVENVCLTRVAFWNQGKQFIDKLDFTDTDPLRIVPSEPVRILYAQHVRGYPQSLRFDSDLKRSGVNITLRGNDG